MKVLHKTALHVCRCWHLHMCTSVHRRSLAKCTISAWPVRHFLSLLLSPSLLIVSFRLLSILVQGLVRQSWRALDLSCTPTISSSSLEPMCAAGGTRQLNQTRHSAGSWREPCKANGDSRYLRRLPVDLNKNRWDGMCF